MLDYAVFGYDYRRESSRVLLATDAAVVSWQGQQLKLTAARKVRHNLKAADLAHSQTGGDD